MHSVITLQDPSAALHSYNLSLDEGQIFIKVSSWSKCIQNACQFVSSLHTLPAKRQGASADRPQVKAENRTSYWTYQI